MTKKTLTLLLALVAAAAFAEPTPTDIALVEKYRAMTFAPTELQLVRKYTGQTLYRLADKTNVWIYTDGYIIAETPEGVSIHVFSKEGAEQSRTFFLPSGRSASFYTGQPLVWSLAKEQAPDFTLPVLGSPGKTVKLSDLRGKIVVLDFWASWCGPCMRALPDTEALYKKLKDKGLLVYAVNVEGDEAKASAAAKSLGLTIPVLMAKPDAKGQYNWSSQQIADYRVSGIPRVFLIDKDGIVQKIDFITEEVLGKYLN
jgi:thiol-disulfide isomerase/thioredoxin